jgi:hypothetical protein
VDGVPTPEPDLLRWGRWFEESGDARRVAVTYFGDGTVRVSTVFLALDHNWGQGPPLLWETLVFGGPLNSLMARYTSKALAEAGHRAIVRQVDAAIAAAMREAVRPADD